MDEMTYMLGQRAVVAELRSHGARYAVEQLYLERDELRRQVDDQQRVIEYLLAGGDPAVVQRRGSP